MADVAAPVVEHEGARYLIGLPGDLVVLGDWDCDGVTTPAVVRPADGTVWSFPSWASGSEVLAAAPVLRTPAPVRATARSGSDGCDLLVVDTGEGKELLVHPDAISQPNDR